MAEEQQDFNEFNRLDSLGAAFFLAIVPAVMYWVFIGHDILQLACIGGIAVLVVLVVLALSYLFSEQATGRIVNKAGTVLAPVYLVLAVWLFWLKWCQPGDTAPEQPAAGQPVQQAPAEPAGD